VVVVGRSIKMMPRLIYNDGCSFTPSRQSHAVVFGRDDPYLIEAPLMWTRLVGPPCDRPFFSPPRFRLGCVVVVVVVGTGCLYMGANVARGAGHARPPNGAPPAK
jgi:hypothetical protein